jgi:hypothetical protein
MTIVRRLALLLLITSLGYSQGLQERHFSREVEAPVQKLYQQLMSRPVGGIPAPERMKLFSPYLSSALLHRIAQARACSNDWFRVHPRNDVKPPFAWGEFGLFSGADDRSGPDTFQIEKVDPGNDSVFRVYIMLTESNPPAKPWTWHVADEVKREGGRYVIDDVIFLRDKDVDTETRLSQILATGCDGPRWVGEGGQQH